MTEGRERDPLRLRLRSLTRADFDHSNPDMSGADELQSVCDSINAQGLVLEYAAEMFSVMERLDDVDLGSPGPLVHALESASPAYESLLADSVQRKPSPLTVWMVNRILNTERRDRDFWLGLLSQTSTNPRASDSTRRDAQAFLVHQAQHRSP